MNIWKNPVSLLMRLPMFSPNKKAAASFEEGFTLLETLAAIAVISVGLLLAGWGGYQLNKRIQDVSETTKFLNELSACEKYFTESVNRIRYPYWARFSIDSMSDREITIPFYEGVENDSLKLAFMEEGLVITGPEIESMVFRRLDEGSFFIIGSGEEPRGLGISLSHNGDTYLLNALLGSVPMYKVRK